MSVILNTHQDTTVGLVEARQLVINAIAATGSVIEAVLALD
jgi:hypothetical protein